MPCALAGNQFPPHAHIFHRLDPRRVLDLARLIQIQNQPRGQHIARVVNDHNRAPWCAARRLHVALTPLGVGREPRLKHHVLIIQIQVHTRVVHQLRLVQVQIDAIVGLEQQLGLHTRLAELLL